MSKIIYALVVLTVVVGAGLHAEAAHKPRLVPVVPVHTVQAPKLVAKLPEPTVAEVQPLQPIAPPRPVTYSGGIISQVITGVNAVRAQHGLAPLHENALLDRSALNHAAYLCTSKTWAHGNWISYITAVGYPYTRAGENLAEGYDNVADTITAWVNSPEHYQNIVGDYTDTGVASVECDDYQGYAQATIIVQHFGEE